MNTFGGIGVFATPYSNTRNGKEEPTRYRIGPQFQAVLPDPTETSTDRGDILCYPLVATDGILDTSTSFHCTLSIGGI